jgi:hypothetical protein
MLNKFVYNLLAVAVSACLFVLTLFLCQLAIQSGVTGGALDVLIFIPFVLLTMTMLWLFADWDKS